MHAVAAVLAGLACCVAAPKAPTPPPFTAFVRVNQVGYPAAASKRAYLMSSASAAGSAFSIRNESGAVVYSGTVGASLGAWNATYPFVEPLDFDAFATTGTYTISLGSTTSPGFRIDTGQNVYATPLANGLFFYQSERDGPNFIPNALRTAPGHVNDTSAMTYVTPNANSSGHFSGDRHADRRERRLVGRRRLHQGRRDPRVRNSAAAARRSRLSHADGRLQRRGEVRYRLAAADVGRLDADLLLPGGHRRRECEDGR